MARCHELLHGAIDLHTHSSPSFYDRLLDDVGLAEQARAAGMRAVLYKAHEQDTTGRAALARRAVPGIEAFGGVVLNHAVGGLNPAAVDASIKLGGRMVWMPTMSAQHHIAHFGGSHFGSGMKGKTPTAGPTNGTVAAAPSDICEELPAVIVPLIWNAAFNFPRASAEVSRRGPSSLSKVISRCCFLPLASSSSTLTVSGTVSSANLFSSRAAAAL